MTEALFLSLIWPGIKCNRLFSKTPQSSFSSLQNFAKTFIVFRFSVDNNNNNNLHLYSANLYMNIFGCALQYCYIKFMLKVTKA